MISASTLNSELINKIAQDFAQATGCGCQYSR